MALDPETFDALIETIRRFVAERLRPLEEKVAEEDEVPDEIVREMREMGLFGLSIPEEFGGLGLTMSEEVRVALEFGRTTPAFRSVFGTNVGIGSQGLVMAGSDAQKAEWLPRIASGEVDHQLRADRAGGRLGRRRGANPRGARWRRLQALRQQALHHQCRQGVAVHGDGADGRGGRARRVGLSRAGRSAGRFDRQARKEDGPAGRPCLRRQFRRGAGARRQPARARKARASRSRCACSTAGGCTSPRSASASPSG